MSHKSSSAKPEEITPPSSFVNVPLTPPASDEKTSPHATFPQANQVVAFFKEIKSGQADRSQPWKKFQLQPGEYSEIERLLLADTSLWGFVDDKIRYDFDGDQNQLIVRMPTQLHEQFLASVKLNIDARLSSLASSTTLEESVVHFAQRVQNLGSPDIFFPIGSETDVASHKLSKNSPDCTYYYDNAKWPGVILEVSYSQKRKDLEKLADRYILDSKANVRAVVGLDIEYQHQKKTKAGSKEAVFSVWRPEIIQNDEGDLELVAAQKIKNQPFRDAQGNPTSSLGLSLLLSEFASSGLSQTIADHDQLITISTDELYQYLHNAEKRLQGQLGDSLYEDDLPAGVKRKRRKSTPPDMLDEKDERKYCAAEKKARQKRDEEDPDWEGGG